MIEPADLPDLPPSWRSAVPQKHDVTWTWWDGDIPYEQTSGVLPRLNVEQMTAYMHGVFENFVRQHKMIAEPSSEGYTVLTVDGVETDENYGYGLRSRTVFEALGYVLDRHPLAAEWTPPPPRWITEAAHLRRPPLP